MPVGAEIPWDQLAADARSEARRANAGGQFFRFRGVGEIVPGDHASSAALYVAGLACQRLTGQ